MNSLQKLFAHKNQNLLSLFFTAGYPNLNDTVDIILAAQSRAVDFLEVGMPYSDPLADGPVIQESSAQAIANGMNIELLFEQLHSIRSQINIPYLLMGYLNPVLQYGTEKFLSQARDCGVSGLILPDLPLDEYEFEYKSLFDEYEISPVFLITPQTSSDRVRRIDKLSNAFIYVVSSTAITGVQKDFGKVQEEYFTRIRSLGLKNPLIAGFGIYNAQTLKLAWSNFNGGICGSAFLKKLATHNQADQALDALLADLLD